MNSMKKTVLITGASGGIGLELAKVFAWEHAPLILVARNLEVLNKLAVELRNEFSIEVHVIAKDLAHPHAAKEIAEYLHTHNLKVDVLVNNAGLGQYGLFAETDAKEEADMMQVNMIALTQLTKLILPGMIERKSGKILNVASTAAFQAGPLMAVYYASKAYVLSFSEALANELEGSGVTVTVLCPGPTESGFQKRARMEGVKLFDAVVMDARTVAEVAYRGLMTHHGLFAFSRASG